MFENKFIVRKEFILENRDNENFMTELLFWIGKNLLF